MNVRVLLTGASGFLGRALGEELSFLGFDVIGVSRQPQLSMPRLTWIEADMNDSSALEELVRNVDVVINGAAKTWNSDAIKCPESFFRINRDAPVELFLAAEKAGVQLFVQISSTGVFGPGDGIYDEVTPCRPKNLYEQSKFAAECALREAKKKANIGLVVVRPSNIFGEAHPRQKLLTWLRYVKSRRAVLATKSTSYWTNYIYLGDVTKSICAIVNAALKSPESSKPKVFNLNCPATAQDFFDASKRSVGNEFQPYELPRLALLALGGACDMASALIGKQLPMTREKGRELTNSQVFSVTRIKSFLPDFPQYGLQEGLNRVCNYYREKGLL